MPDTPDDGPDLSVLPDLTDWSDEQLTALDILLEETREARRRRATIPGTIAALATQYEQGGGDRADLVDALTPEERTALTGVPTDPQPSSAAHFDYLDG